jgi:hypothetical protein
MQRSQILDRVPVFVPPLIARQTTAKMPPAIVDLDERLFALGAGVGHF